MLDGLPKMLMAVVSMLALAACQNFHVAQDGWLGQDKAKHFAVSAGMSMAAAAAMREAGVGHSRKAGLAIGVSVGIGLGKELADSQRAQSGFSWRDLAYDVGGAIAGYQLYRLVN